MQHPTLLRLFLYLQFLLFVVSYNSERIPRADAVEFARYERTQSQLSIPPKRETRNIMHMGEKPKQEGGLQAVGEAKPLVEKRGGKSSKIDAKPIAQRMKPKKYPNPLDTSRIACRMIHHPWPGHGRCDFTRCLEVGGRCKVAIEDGRETCIEARTLKNGDKVAATWRLDLWSCNGCSCEAVANVQQRL
jgi:hypothetical protein